ncbi:MAG: peptidase C69 [Deltaproteobacteria bacterium CG_4_8_14_3_um_filter_45_9]|nr:MAG: peptidase C69 [Deltaproteobacteria bacterium CG_4_8_14_3_um_filter_45_9]
MKHLIQNILDVAKLKGVEYADIRIVRRQSEEIEVKNGKVGALIHDEDFGFGIRVLFQGAWGFACSSKVTKREMEAVFGKALKIAKASSRVKGKEIVFTSTSPVVDRYKTTMAIDPFNVPPETKLNLLLKADETIRRNKKVKISEAFLGSYKTEKTFASTEGSYIEQEIVECGAGISATAIEGSEVQVRSYPNSFRGNFSTQGYEWIENLDLTDQAERMAEEASQLLTAKPCPSKTTTLILDSSQLALQIHESIGHPIELDRILGTEASYAGTSFLKPEMVGHFKYGSELVNIVADATCPGGLGTFGYDDEGIKAQRVPIISQGILVNLLTSRETAHHLGKESNGTMRADGWNRIPLIRMTNINLEPGEWTLEQMIADTEEGLFLTTNRSWSIDDKRINFQFGTEIGWEIKSGKLGEMVKNPTYTGITPTFWSSCDAIANRDHWQMWGTPNCGKGEPGQVAHVGHGAAPARFRNVQVGVMKLI